MPTLSSNCSAVSRPWRCCYADMLFQHNELRQDAPRLAHIDIFRHAVARADYIGTQAQTGIPVAFAIGAGRFGLHPVEHGEAQLLAFTQGFLFCLFRHAQQRLEPVVDLGPVDQRDIAGEGAFGIVILVQDAAEVPEIARSAGVTVAKVGVEDLAMDRLPASAGWSNTQLSCLSGQKSALYSRQKS